MKERGGRYGECALYQRDRARNYMNVGRIYNAPGCNRVWIVDERQRRRALLLTIGGYVRAVARRTVARDRSIEILYRPGVRVTFLDGCS